jgi:hypothetical protein
MSNEPRALATRQAAPVAMRTDNLDTLTVAKMLAESGFFGEVRDAGKALAKILAGQELGMGPIASLMGVYYQQGKVSYSANIMAAAVKKNGQYTYRVRHHDDERCSLEFFTRSSGGWESIGTSDFTMEDAERAGLTTGANKHNWKNYPRNMLFARAMSNGVKWHTPDVFGGVTPYTPDEIGAEVVVGDDGEMRPVVSDAPALSGDVIDPAPSGWTPAAEQRWQAGVAKAIEVGAAVPEKPATDAAREAVLAALQEMAGNIKARQELVAALEDVVKVANDAGGEFEIPENVADLSDEQVGEMIAAIQGTIAVAGAA